MNTNTKKPTEPLLMRLMMAAVFLPMILTCLGLFLLLYLIFGIPQNHKAVFGVIPMTMFTVWVLVLVPAACFALILWKGGWRPAVILLTVNFLLGFYFTADNHYVRVAPEKRLIVFDRTMPAGADVYCNGVLLGQVPLSISVADLKAKVPEWPTPPEQPWFVDLVNPVYTWYPWDRFEQDRYEEFRFFDAKKSTLGFDTASKYWWKVEYRGAVACFCDNYRDPYMVDERYRFDRVHDYQWRSNLLHFPAKQAVMDVLASSWPQLSEEEKTLWAEYVCTLPHEWLFGGGLSNQRDVYEEMMERVARAKYRFEKNPSAEECRRVLNQIIAENKDNALSFSGDEFGFDNTSTVNLSKGWLAGYALEQLGENSLIPVQELLRTNWFRYDDRLAPLVYAGESLNSPELFDDFARLYAKSGCTLSAVLTNPDDRAIPLFHTLMANRTLSFRMNRDSEIRCKIGVLTYTTTDRLEPLIRDEIARLVAGQHGATFEYELERFVSARMRTTPEQIKELRQWVQSLRIAPDVKSRIFGDNSMSVQVANFQSADGVLTQMAMPNPSMIFIPGTQVIMLLDDDNDPPLITTAMLCDWLREHPDKLIGDYFDAIDTGLKKGVDVVNVSLMRLIEDESPEAGDVLQRYWNDPELKDALIMAIQLLFSQPMSVNMNINMTMTYQDQWRDTDGVRLPGMYHELIPGRFGTRFVSKVNPVVVEMFGEINDAELWQLCMGFITATRKRDIPGVAGLLEKWSTSDVEPLKQAALESLDLAQKRERIRSQSRELLLQLAAGTITPDDLLPSPVPWVWENGKYVQKEGVRD